MKKILVTGGAGYIGSHTVVELHNEGYLPIIIDNFSNSEKSIVDGINAILGGDIRVYDGDCNDTSFLNQLFEKEKNIAAVIHFAAYKAVGESVQKPLEYYQNNIGSLISLVQAMKMYEVNNIVFSSSCTVYGEPDVLPVTELSPIKPAESPYGNTKQICEEILTDVVNSQVGINAVALRYFNPIGAHPSAKIGELPLGVPNNLVPFVTQTAVGIRNEVIVFGNDYDTPDGTCIRDYIHVVDLAKAHVKALNSLHDKINFYDVFNIGTGQGNSVLEVIQTFEKVSGKKLNYKIGERRQGDVEKVYGKVDKANTHFHWKAELSLQKALEDAWRWERSINSN